MYGFEDKCFLGMSFCQNFLYDHWVIRNRFSSSVHQDLVLAQTKMGKSLPLPIFRQISNNFRSLSFCSSNSLKPFIFSYCRTAITFSGYLSFTRRCLMSSNIESTSENFPLPFVFDLQLRALATKLALPGWYLISHW